MHPQRLIESAVLSSEIQMLQPFEGYLCITGHHRARVTIPYLAPVKRHPGFVRRLMAYAQQLGIGWTAWSWFNDPFLVNRYQVTSFGDIVKQGLAAERTL